MMKAARFRVYAFDKHGEVLGEVNKANGFDLNWSLEVANQKAAWFTFMGNFIIFHVIICFDALSPTRQPTTWRIPAWVYHPAQPNRPT
jgi:hypothetical protein